jgi:hypothetical protein
LAGAVAFAATAHGPTPEKDRLVYSFTGGSDGGSPAAGFATDEKGNLYSTSYGSGASQRGAVFRIGDDRRHRERLLRKSGLRIGIPAEAITHAPPSDLPWQAGSQLPVKQGVKNALPRLFRFGTWGAPTAF